MPVDKWTLGETAVFPLLILDANGVAIDPQSIRLLIKPPSAPVITVAAPARLALGKFEHNQLLDQPGNWYYRWELTAPHAAVAEGTFNVERSRFAA